MQATKGLAQRGETLFIYTLYYYKVNHKQTGNMIRKDTFTDEQKKAIVATSLEIINADNVVALEEHEYFNEMRDRVDIDDEIFEAGRKMALEQACEILKKMREAKRLQVISILVDVIESDDQLENEEINQICKIVKMIDMDRFFDQVKE